MLFIGHTRFSLFEPDSGAWHASKGSRFTTHDEYREHLFSETRLSARAEIFFNESLPQISAGIGEHDVLHVVSYSEQLPDKYQKALHEAAARHPFVVLDLHAGGKSSHSPAAVARDAVARLQPAGGVFGMYRLDDDDLLSTAYFNQAAPYITQAHVGWMVSLGSGITGVRIGSGYYDLRQSHYPLVTAGLLSICQVSGAGKIVQPVSAPHESSDRVNPVIVDGRVLGYFWGRHELQDTAIGRKPSTAAEAINRLRDSISGHPALQSTDGLRELFPAVWQKMHLAGDPSEVVGDNLLPTKTDLDEGGLAVSFDPIRGHLGISVTLDCSGAPVKHNALVSLELTDSSGNKLPADLDAELLHAGIVRSGNTSIGYYRYLQTQEGERTTRYTFELPEGVECRGALIRRFAKDDTRVTATSAAFYEAQPSAVVVAG